MKKNYTSYYLNIFSLFFLLIAIFTPITNLYAGESKGVAKITYTGWDGHKKQMPEAKNNAKINALERFANDNFSKSRFKDYMQAKNSILSNLDGIVSIDHVLQEEVDKKNKTITIVIRANINENKLNFLIDDLVGITNATSSEKSEMAVYIIARKASELKIFKPKEFNKSMASESSDSSETIAASGESAIVSTSSENSSSSTTGGSTTQKSDKIKYGPVDGANDDIFANMSKVFSEYDFDVFEFIELDVDDRVSEAYMKGDGLSAKNKKYMWNAVKDDDVPYLVFATATIDAKAIDSVSGATTVGVTVSGLVYFCEKRCKVQASVGPVQYHANGQSELEAQRNSILLAGTKASQELIDQLNAKGVQ